MRGADEKLTHTNIYVRVRYGQGSCTEYLNFIQRSKRDNIPCWRCRPAERRTRALAEGRVPEGSKVGRGAGSKVKSGSGSVLYCKEWRIALLYCIQGCFFVDSLVLTFNSNAPTPSPDAAPVPERPIKCSLPMLLANNEAPTCSTEGELVSLLHCQHCTLFRVAMPDEYIGLERFCSNVLQAGGATPQLPPRCGVGTYKKTN